MDVVGGMIQEKEKSDGDLTIVNLYKQTHRTGDMWREDDLWGGSQRMRRGIRVKGRSA